LVVDNNCSCTHHRSKHTLSEDSDVSIRGKCEFEKCTCQLYHQMNGKITPVQYKYLFVGSLAIISIIVAGGIGIFVVNESVNNSHDSYYKIWKGDVDNFSGNIASQYGENATISDVKKYLDMNTDEFKDSKNASGILIPTVIGLIVTIIILIMIYDRERKDELLE